MDRMDGWVDEWVDGQMGGRVVGWTGGWVHGWLGGWMDGWVHAEEKRVYGTQQLQDGNGNGEVGAVHLRAW